jgi:hypothetical protein
MMGIKVSLHFHHKVPARYKLLSNMVLKPWARVHGVEELKLSGDIRTPMFKNLQMRMLQGPFSNEVTEFFEQQRLLAEGEYRRKYYNSARSHWTKLCDYWDYLYRLRTHLEERRKIVDPVNKLEHVLRASIPAYMESRVGQIETAIHLFEYHEVLQIASWMTVRAPQYHTTPLMVMKYSLGYSLALTALGNIEPGVRNLELAARSLFRTGRYADKSEENLLEELRSAVDNELIQRNSVWRCGCKVQLSVEGQSGKEWEIRQGCRSFWEWLDEPEDVSEVSSV